MIDLALFVVLYVGLAITGGLTRIGYYTWPWWRQTFALCVMGAAVVLVRA